MQHSQLCSSRLNGFLQAKREKRGRRSCFSARRLPRFPRFSRLIKTKLTKGDWYAGYMRQEITRAIFFNAYSKGYGKVKLVWASPRRRCLFKSPLPYFSNEVLILMLAPNTPPNCVTSLRSRRLKGKGIPGAQKVQKAREGEGRKSPPLLPFPSSAVSRPNSLLFPFERLPHRLPA